MKRYESWANIVARPAAGSRELADRAAWSARDSGVTGIDRRIAPGATIVIRSAAARGWAVPVKSGPAPTSDG
jgi:hypothetical protein